VVQQLFLQPARIPDQNLPAGDVLGLKLSVSGVGNLPFLGTVQAVSDSQKVIPNSNILIEQLGTNLYALTAFPMGSRRWECQLQSGFTGWSRGSR
jgi:hypothetical protein